MWLARVALIAGAVTALSSSAHADTITGRVIEWRPAAKMLVMEDKTRIYVDPKMITSDPTNKRVVIDYAGAEGIAKILNVRILN